ncbi:hypothetical protein B0H13DRAFT_685035 [Mycena leptocephala]|nr:hypothetical protein B0H13DRAFT_685035 [Mycena leptocephala]
MVEPVSIFLALNTAGHTSAELFNFLNKRMPQSRLKKWKKAAQIISQDALAHKETLQEDQIPKYLSRYAAFASSLQELDECYDMNGHTARGFLHRWEAAKNVQKNGKVIRDLARDAMTQGSNNAFICSVYHEQPKNGEKCGICFPSAALAARDARDSHSSLVSEASISNDRSNSTACGSFDRTEAPLHVDVAKIPHHGVRMVPHTPPGSAPKLTQVVKVVQVSGHGKMLICEEYEYDS